MPRIHLDERGTSLRLGEAAGSRRRILLITPGQGSSGTYPPDVLERDGPRAIPAGTQMFLDHPGRAEERDRPERSVRDLAAVLETDAVWDAQGSDGPGLYAEARILPTMAPVVDALAEHIGVSIRGYGQADPDGTITALTAVESVDFVTKAGRGGRVLEILESARPTVEALTANELRARLDSILSDRHGDDDTWVWVADYSTDEGWVVFSIETRTESTYYRADLTVDDEDVTVGEEETEVERRTDYVPVDQVTEAIREARQAVREARNVGQWFESHIHLDFTTTADQMAADGRLTRDERIALSNAIGDALAAFTATVEDLAPHLFDRDPYTEPDPTIHPITTEEADVATVEELNARVSALESERDTAITERDEARTELARRRDADRLREANDAIATAVAGVEVPDTLTSVAESIRERAAARVQVTRDGEGAIVTDALTESARNAVQTEVEYLSTVTGGTGVKGLGEGATTPPAPKTDDELREANAERATKLLSA